MKDVDLSKLRNIFVGAERVDEVCLRDFAQTFSPHGLSRSALQPCYGMAESTLAVTMHNTNFNYDEQALSYVISDRIDSGSVIDHWQARRADDNSRRVETVLSMGRPISGMQVAVRALDNSDAKDREVGEIFIRGTSVMSGYLPAEGQAEHYQSGDWFATGDIGYRVDEHLFVLGRKKELIIIRGSNYFPHEIEDVIALHPLLASGGNAIAAFGIYDEAQRTESLAILVELDAKQNQLELRTQLQNQLRDKFGFGAHAINFVPPGSLPRTTSNKLKRLECRTIYLQTVVNNNDKTDIAQLVS